jgi:hypothetical protein
MAKSETFNVPVSCVDAVIALCTPMVGRSKYLGVSVYHEGNGKIEMYGGNNAERSQFRQLADKVTRRETANSVCVEPATVAQINYLQSLILDDPGMATTVGASLDGSRVTPNLSKATASKMIDQLKNGI